LQRTPPQFARCMPPQRPSPLSTLIQSINQSINQSIDQGELEAGASTQRRGLLCCHSGHDMVHFTGQSKFVAPSSESRVTPLRADRKETLLYHAAQSGRKAPIYFSSVTTPRRAPYKVGRPSKQAFSVTPAPLLASYELVPGRANVAKGSTFWPLDFLALSRGRSVKWPTCRCHLQHPQRQVRVSSSATSGESHVSEIARHANSTSCALACLARARSVCVFV
jgi:hypothetical protein